MMMSNQHVRPHLKTVMMIRHLMYRMEKRLHMQSWSSSFFK